LDETLESLEEVPETQEQGATAFVVGDSSGESEVEIQPQLPTQNQKRPSVPNIISAITATMLTTMGTITGKNNDPSEARKLSRSEKVRKTSEIETAANPTRGPTGQSPLPATGFAMGPLTVKEENVTINVEEDQC